jgi:riboflavin biosynthesis pyrimidine reductase
MARLIELYPQSGRECALEGLYLGHGIHALGSAASPFVYANFVSSLDGRIALVDPKTQQSTLPEALTSGNDFRLFSELQAQADCLITHGGYLRAIAEGQLDDVLEIGTTRSDLSAWRKEQGLPPQPAVVVASASLDFPLPDSVRGRRVFIATGASADPARVRAFEAQGYRVIRAGRGRLVEGAPLVTALGGLGLTRLYLLAGPLMLAAMIRDQLLSRLYLTLTHQILGGYAFHTLFRGPPLAPAQRLRLASLYYDPSSPGGAGQWFGRFDCTC